MILGSFQRNVQVQTNGCCKLILIHSALGLFQKQFYFVDLLGTGSICAATMTYMAFVHDGEPFSTLLWSVSQQLKQGSRRNQHILIFLEELFRREKRTSPLTCKTDLRRGNPSMRSNCFPLPLRMMVNQVMLPFLGRSRETSSCQLTSFGVKVCKSSWQWLKRMPSVGSKKKDIVLQPLLAEHEAGPLCPTQDFKISKCKRTARDCMDPTVNMRQCRPEHSRANSGLHCLLERGVRGLGVPPVIADSFAQELSRCQAAVSLGGITRAAEGALPRWPCLPGLPLPAWIAPGESERSCTARSMPPEHPLDRIGPQLQLGSESARGGPLGGCSAKFSLLKDPNAHIRLTTFPPEQPQR